MADYGYESPSDQATEATMGTRRVDGAYVRPRAGAPEVAVRSDREHRPATLGLGSGGWVPGARVALAVAAGYLSVLFIRTLLRWMLPLALVIAGTVLLLNAGDILAGLRRALGG